MRASRDGQFELIASELLLTELTRTLAYPRIRERIPQEKAAAYVNWIRDPGRLADDPVGAPPVASRDPDDDYLVALAIDQRAYLVTGDQDLLVLNARLPILAPAQFRDATLPTDDRIVRRLTQPATAERRRNYSGQRGFMGHVDMGME